MTRKVAMWMAAGDWLRRGRPQKMRKRWRPEMGTEGGGRRRRGRKMEMRRGMRRMLMRRVTEMRRRKDTRRTSDEHDRAKVDEAGGMTITIGRSNDYPNGAAMRAKTRLVSRTTMPFTRGHTVRKRGGKDEK